jgi:4-hydroxy-4-methyl-2-oxoglutarate aldolase
VTRAGERMAEEHELRGVRGRLLGLVSEEKIVRVNILRPAADVISGYLKLKDLCSTTADALDQLGVGGAVGLSELHPLSPGRICGPAITIRYGREGGSVGALSSRGEKARLAERDLYGIGSTGDVAVFDCGGFVGASVMGSLSARWAQHLDIAGCVVDGAIRDVDSIRELGFAVWSRGVTPLSGKHRLRALELNGSVSIAGLTVDPGDLVVADATGVCIVPHTFATEVLECCRELERKERDVEDAMDRGAGPAEIARHHPPDRW